MGSVCKKTTPSQPEIKHYQPNDINHNFIDEPWQEHPSSNKKVIQLQNGTTYEGQYAQKENIELPHGQGWEKHTNNQQYSGDFYYGKKNGFGKYTFQTGDVYQGSFENNMIHGHGKLLFHNGDIYQGGFQNNKFHGWGKYTNSIGDYYEGEYQFGQRHGQGTLGRQDGTTALAGKWQNGEIKLNESKISSVNKDTISQGRYNYQANRFKDDESEYNESQRSQHSKKISLKNSRRSFKQSKASQRSNGQQYY